jgi:predicted outer membrane repeat protein
MGKRDHLLFISLIIGIFILGWMPRSHAADIQVSPNSGAQAEVTADDGVCTLREAFTNAYEDYKVYSDCVVAGSGDDTIILPPGVYNFKSSHMEDGLGRNALGPVGGAKGGNLTIKGDGTGSVTIQRDPSAMQDFRILYVEYPGILTLKDLSLKNGRSEQDGGAIRNEGTLVIQNCTLSNNTSTGSGGAIYTRGPAMFIVSSTLSGNQTSGPPGGAIFVDGSGILIESSTIVENTSPGGPAGAIGGGIYYDTNKPNGKVYALNTLLANNTPDNCNTKIYLSYGHNLETGNKCGLDTNLGDLVDVSLSDLHLGQLQDNGGPTPTHGLSSGSKAIDQGDPNGCKELFSGPLSTDQRGFSRQVDGGSGTSRCDIGAFEFDPAKDIPKAVESPIASSQPKVEAKAPPPPAPASSGASARGGGGCSLNNGDFNLDISLWSLLVLGSALGSGVLRLVKRRR